MEIAAQLLINAVIAGSVYALVASGLTFIYATSKIFHLAHGVVIVFGAYTFHWAWIEQGWAVWLAVIASIVVSVAIGLGTSELVYEQQRKRGAKKLSYLISTIALLMLGTSTIILFFGSSLKTFGIQTEVYRWSELNITLMQLILIVVSMATLFVLSWIVKHTRFGKAMRATADND